MHEALAPAPPFVPRGICGGRPPAFLPMLELDIALGRDREFVATPVEDGRDSALRVPSFGGPRRAMKHLGDRIGDGDTKVTLHRILHAAFAAFRTDGQTKG